MSTVPYLVNNVYEIWSNAVKEKVGNNYSMKRSEVVNKLPYASCYFMGFPTTKTDLEGNELAVTPSVQIDIYANGQKALSTVYEIDELSHKAMISMGFKRTFGAELMQNLSDETITRLTSTYSRVVGGGDTIRVINE